MDNREAIKFKIKYKYRFAKKNKRLCDNCGRCYNNEIQKTMTCIGRTEKECKNLEYPVQFLTYSNHTCDYWKKMSK